MKNKKIFGMGMILVMAILAASTALAFGVSSPYWEGNPLTIYPGETKTAQLGYQNMGENVEDLTVRAEITKGGEIASLSQQDYVVAANTRDTQVNIVVSIPASAEIGTEYKVTLTSKTVTPGTAGGIGLGVGMDTTFDILVIEKPVVQEALPEEVAGVSNIIIFVLLALIILAIILLVVIQARKKSKKNK
ncbi:hypothetical protein A3K73_02950 [Candidatus Pacearchaeota archaeon RBG_13_36_9]|nr:MAG: hypothetical protein A3K73_02950 [Candidatus Pacearchaeota archaeon RBG_13_36_9]